MKIHMSLYRKCVARSAVPRRGRQGGVSEESLVPVWLKSVLRANLD